MGKILQILSISIFVAFQVMAQGRVITGRVSSSEDGRTLAGVTVQVVGSKVLTYTNDEGQYVVQTAADSKSLKFFFLGFKPQEVLLGDKTTVDVALIPDTKALDEVVIIGYGSAKSLGTVVASVVKIENKEIANKPLANVFDALQGKVAGLQVYSESGEPAALSWMRIHGVGSFGTSTSPIILLDGVEIEQSLLITMNPNDFESIEVLKDASATSIFGSRASNGVIFITSKKGTLNTPTYISLSSEYSVSALTNSTIKIYESYMNTKELTDFWVETKQRTRESVDELLKKYPNDTKWYKYYFKKLVPTYQTNMSITGGSGKSTFYLSGSYFNQEGLTHGSSYERYNIFTNVNTQLGNAFSMGLKLIAGLDTRQSNQYGFESLNRGLSNLRAPFYTPYDADGNEYPVKIPGGEFYNPKYLAEKIRNVEKFNIISPSIFFQLIPLEGLTLKTVLGGHLIYSTNEGLIMSSFLSAGGSGSVQQTFIKNLSHSITNTIEYKFNVDKAEKHKFVVLLGQEYSDNETATQAAFGAGLISDNLISLQNTLPITRIITSSKNDHSYYSFFGRIDYNLLDRYVLEASLREDASSRFGENNKRAVFFSTGFLWNMKREHFLKDIDWLNELSLKFSTGTAGNSDISNYLHLATAGSNTNYGEIGFFVDQPGNPSLTWEKQRKTTYGIRAKLFNHWNLNVEFYKRLTTNMLVEVPLPYTTGFPNYTDNVGSLQNTGIDVELNFNYTIDKAKQIYINSYFNINFNENKIKELYHGKHYWQRPGYAESWAVGQRVNHLLPLWAGVNPETGMPQWYLPDSGDPQQGQGQVLTQRDPTKITTTFSSALQQNTGRRRYAPYHGGFGFQSGWGHFGLNANFAFILGKYTLNRDRYYFENPTLQVGNNQSRNVFDYWKKPGDITRFPKYGQQFTYIDDRLLENSSFMRLKYLELSYDLPATLLKPLAIIKSARFTLGARNLFTWTKFTGPDPEVDLGFTQGANPNTRQYMVGLNIVF